MEQENGRLTASSVAGHQGLLPARCGHWDPQGRPGADGPGEIGKKGGAQTLELRAGSEHRPQRCEQHPGSEGSVGTGRTRSGLERP